MKIYSGRKKETVFILGIALILAVILWSLGKMIWPILSKNEKSRSKVSEEIASVPFINNDELYNMLRNQRKVVIVDTRVREDFKKGHIERSLNIPSESFNSEALVKENVSKTDDVVFCDAEGKIEMMALFTKNAQSEGFINAKYLRGGLLSWKAAGYPLVSGDVAPNINKGKVKSITPEQFAISLEVDYIDPQIIDIRSRNDYEKEHIITAENIPLVELEKSISKISTIKTVLIYGGSKDDQDYAASILFDMNFINIYTLEGGLDAWKNVGGKVESK